MSNDRMVRQAERVLLGQMPLTAKAYPLRVHHEPVLVTKEPANPVRPELVEGLNGAQTDGHSALTELLSID